MIYNKLCAFKCGEYITVELMRYDWYFKIYIHCFRLYRS